MRQGLRVVLMGAFASALLGFLPYLTSPAHAQAEIHLNSSTVQVVHNVPANTDVLNLSLNVRNDGDGGLDPCESEVDDLLETGVHISVWRGSCFDFFAICNSLAGCPTLDFDAQVNYVEHQIGSASYGTSFGPNADGFVSSKIVALATPPGTCGTWSINLQGTGQNLSGITGPSVALFVNDSDHDANGLAFAECFDVNASVGNGITKPARGVHATRRR
jgi:hypothetical protein